MKIKNLSADSIRKFYESAMVQIQLYNLGYELMFIDEFSINFMHNKIYGWASVGVKGDLDVNIELFIISFMAGFSKQRFYEFVGASTTNDFASFLSF